MVAHHHAAARRRRLLFALKDRARTVAPVSTHRHFFFSFCGAMAAMFTGLARAVKPFRFSSRRHSGPENSRGSSAAEPAFASHFPFLGSGIAVVMRNLDETNEFGAGLLLDPT